MKSLIMMLLFPFALLFTQDNGIDAIRKEAADAMARKNWQAAVLLYEKIANAEPSNAGALARMATAYYNLNRFQESAAAYERSLAIQPAAPVMYNLTCAYARAGFSNKAWPWLEQAAVSGWFTSDQMRADPDLVILHSTRFDSLMGEADRINRPCEFDSVARQFDFWIGDWDVFTPQGQKAGTNLIQRNEDGCLLVENWKGAYGGTGKSINFFDTNLKAWRQIWVDNRRNSAEFTGQYHDSIMDFQGVKLLPDNKKAKTRLRFFFITAEKVRQFAEQSLDDGKTWQTTYDFMYIRRK